MLLDHHQVTRRGFLLGSAAMAVVALSPSSSWALGPVKPTKMRAAISQGLGRVFKKNNIAAKAKPVNPPRTTEQYRAAYRNIAATANERAAARLAAQAAASGAAEGRMMWGLVGGMARLGARVGRGISLLGAGLTILWAGSELYNWFVGNGGDKDALAQCAVNSYCKVKTSDGKEYVTTTTNEPSPSQSNWSLFGKNWSVNKSISTSVNGKFSHYVVHWTWVPHNGWTVDTFDPQLEISPYVRGVGQTQLANQLQASGKLDAPLTRQDLATILDALIGGSVKSDPDLWPAEYSNAQTQNQRPVVTEDDLSDYDGTGTLNDLFESWPTVTTGTDDFTLFDPDIAAGVATDTAVDPTTGTPPTPTPTPTSGTGGTGGSGGSSGPPTEDAVSANDPGALPEFEKFAGPFRKAWDGVAGAFRPDPAACPTLHVGSSYVGTEAYGGTLGPFDFDYHCRIFEPFRGKIVACFTAFGVWSGIKQAASA